MYDHIIMAIALFLFADLLLVALMLWVGRSLAKRREFDESMFTVPDLIDHTQN